MTITGCVAPSVIRVATWRGQLKFLRKSNPRLKVRFFFHEMNAKSVFNGFILFAVYVFLGEKAFLRLFNQAIEDVELWRANEYLVVSCDSEAFSTSWAVDFIKRN